MSVVNKDDTYYINTEFLFVLESLLNPFERVKRLLKEFFLIRANLPRHLYKNAELHQHPAITASDYSLAVSIVSSFRFNVCHSVLS
jgi:hypothetical protein